MKLLELNRATVVRSGHRILDDLTLCIEEGSHTAILGPNGSGKSSLIRLVTRQWYPLALRSDQAPIAIFGLERWDVSELRNLLGIVSTDLEHAFALSERRTGFEAVLSGFFASHGVFSHHSVTPEMQRAALVALATMEASHLADKHVNAMSTGESRRVLIARALASNPRALLLDEPSAGLDPVARRRFLERLRLVAKAGKTLVMVTHHIEEVLPEIERVILMKEGRVFADGRKADVLTGAALSELFDARMRVSERGGYYACEVGDG